MADQIDFLIRQLPNLLWGFPNNRPGGLLLSIMLSFGSIAVGLTLGTALAFARLSSIKAVAWLARRLAWLVRGIPLVVLLVLVFQFLASGLGASSLWSAAVTLIFYSAVYLSDVLIDGIRGVPQQLRDDARVLGAGPLTLARTVTLPHAFRSTAPALVTQAVTVFKDSSAVVILGVADLTTTARIALGGDVTNAPFWVATYLVVGLLYWGVAFGLSRLVERRLGHRRHRSPLAHV